MHLLVLLRMLPKSLLFAEQFLRGENFLVFVEAVSGHKLSARSIVSVHLCVA